VKNDKTQREQFLVKKTRCEKYLQHTQSENEIKLCIRLRLLYFMGSLRHPKWIANRFFLFRARVKATRVFKFFFLTYANCKTFSFVFSFKLNSVFFLTI
jgi:hypothetical protein